MKHRQAHHGNPYIEIRIQRSPYKPTWRPVFYRGPWHQLFWFRFVITWHFPGPVMGLHVVGGTDTIPEGGGPKLGRGSTGVPRMDAKMNEAPGIRGL